MECAILSVQYCMYVAMTHETTISIKIWLYSLRMKIWIVSIKVLLLFSEVNFSLRVPPFKSTSDTLNLDECLKAAFEAKNEENNCSKRSSYALGLNILSLSGLELKVCVIFTAGHKMSRVDHDNSKTSFQGFHNREYATELASRPIVTWEYMQAASISGKIVWFFRIM